MSLQSGLLYMIFYGLTIGVQGLGLDSINLNGIALGSAQSVGFLVVLPFAYKMKRKVWSFIFQNLIVISAGVLIILSFIKGNQYVPLAETLISTCVVGGTMAANFPIFYLYVAEMFPTETRGLANAIILFLGKMLGATAPFICELCKDMGLHIVVGCCILVLTTIPTLGFIPETAGKKDVGDENDETEEDITKDSIKHPLLTNESRDI